MEIMAALEALRHWTTQPVSEIEVVSDSTYVVNCFRDRWWQGWERRNWLNTQSTAKVDNYDTVKPTLTAAFLAQYDVLLGDKFGTLTPRLDASYQGGIYTAAANSPLRSPRVVADIAVSSRFLNSTSSSRPSA